MWHQPSLSGGYLQRCSLPGAPLPLSSQKGSLEHLGCIWLPLSPPGLYSQRYVSYLVATRVVLAKTKEVKHFQFLLSSGYGSWFPAAEFGEQWVPQWEQAVPSREHPVWHSSGGFPQLVCMLLLTSKCWKAPGLPPQCPAQGPGSRLPLLPPSLLKV